MKYSFLLRTRITLFFIVSFALILTIKLFYVQIVNATIYGEKAEHQYATPVGDIYERGTIYFSRKDGVLVSAAAQTSGFKVAIDPGKITDGDFVYQKLSKVVVLDHDEFIKKTEKE